MCINYHVLNKITIKNNYFLPCIDNLLDQLNGVKYFNWTDFKLGSRLWWLPCVRHNTIHTFGCKCTLVSCQYKVNLGQPRINLSQRDFWATRGRFMGDQNWAHFGCHKAYGDGKILIVASLTMKIFQSSQAWWLKIFSRQACGDWNAFTTNHATTEKNLITTQLAMNVFGHQATTKSILSPFMWQLKTNSVPTCF